LEKGKEESQNNVIIGQEGGPSLLRTVHNHVTTILKWAKQNSNPQYSREIAGTGDPSSAEKIGTSKGGRANCRRPKKNPPRKKTAVRN